MSDLEEKKRIAKQFLTAMGAGDVETVMKLTSDDLEYWIAGSLPVSGSHDRDAVRAMLGTFRSMLRGALRFETTGLTAEGDRVAVEAKGDGQLVSGKFYRNIYHYLFEFRNQKIHRVREYMDTAYAADAMRP